MSKNKVRKFITGIALTLIVAFSAAFSACALETSHPKAQITFEFNSKQYVIEYKLYRNMYPQTVRHFIELANEGFYNDMVVHNYATNDWFTGGYSYDAEDYAAKSVNAGAFAEYFDAHNKEDEYYELFNANKLTSSVYGNVAYDGNKQKVEDKDKLPVVMGEFKNNIQQGIANGALTAEFGSLKMFYYTKETTRKVYVTPTKDQISQADYKNNCATSLFAVQTGTTSSYNATKYTVFATLLSFDLFNDLLDDIKEYFEDKDDTVRVTVEVDKNESFSEKDADKAIEQQFEALTTPLIVKSVKITRY